MCKQELTLTLHIDVTDPPFIHDADIYAPKTLFRDGDKIVTVSGRLDSIVHKQWKAGEGDGFVSEIGEEFTSQKLVTGKEIEMSDGFDALSTTKNMMLAEVFGNEVLSKFPFGK